MQTPTLVREVTTLSAEDCFAINSRTKDEFNYPIHFHPEFEINFIENAKGARRIIGDSVEEIDDLELCLIGSESLEHVWVNNNHKFKGIFEITIHFHKDLFLGSFLNKTQFQSVAVMFEKAKKGMVFSRETIENVKDKLKSLCTKQSGFYSVMELLRILYELSIDQNSRVLCSRTSSSQNESLGNRKIQSIIRFLNDNYQKDIRLIDVANHVNMSEVSFSRFIKRCTGKNYIEYLNDLRLGVASRCLVDSSKSISEISYDCGFNNMSNFNRIFKKRKGYTPTEFRENNSKMRVLI